MKHSTFYLLIFLGLNFLTFSQTKVVPPFVFGKLPCKNPNYKYKTASGEGSTVQEARQRANNFFLEQLPGFNDIEQKCRTEISSQIKSGQSNYLDKFDCVSDNKRIAKYITGLVGYYEEKKSNRYQFYGLYAFTDEVDHMNFARVDYTNKYGAAPIWRSALLPGWGQRYKGDRKFKAASFFIGTVAAAAFGFYASIQHDDLITKSRSRAYSLSQRRDFQNQASQWQNLQIIGFSVGIGIYGFNLVDAITKPGKLRYKCN